MVLPMNDIYWVLTTHQVITMYRLNFSNYD